MKYINSVARTNKLIARRCTRKRSGARARMICRPRYWVVRPRRTLILNIYANFVLLWRYLGRCISDYNQNTRDIIGSIIDRALYTGNCQKWAHTVRDSVTSWKPNGLQSCATTISFCKTTFRLLLNCLVVCTTWLLFSANFLFTVLVIMSLVFLSGSEPTLFLTKLAVAG